MAAKDFVQVADKVKVELIKEDHLCPQCDSRSTKSEKNPQIRTCNNTICGEWWITS